jgi:hypothetical protein
MKPIFSDKTRKARFAVSDTTRKGATAAYVRLNDQEMAAVKREAQRRGRTVASLLYMLLHNTTDGFQAFDEADRPKTGQPSEVAEIVA